MERYITAVERGVDSVQAGREAFGDLGQLQTKFDAFVNRVKPPPTELSISPANDPGGPARTLSASEFEARRADFEALRGRVDDAQGDLEEAINTEPSLAEAEQSLGFLLLNKKNVDDAEKHFERAVQLDPKDALNFYGSGLVALAQASSPQAPAAAAEAFEKAVALNPEFAAPWYRLAMIYSERDETLDKALADARRAASLEPGSASYQRQVAAIQNQLGHPTETGNSAGRVQEPASNRNVANKAADPVVKSANTPPPPAPVSSNSPQAKSISQPAAAPAPTAATRAETPAAAAPAPPMFSETKIYSMIGTVTDVICSAAPQVQLSLKSIALLMKLHTTDLSKLPIKSADSASPMKSPACSSLRGRSVRISYTLVLNQPWDGEMQELEFRALP
jgi:tetratricopeptide (TPR) repeat protein